jgi:NAD(P)-dependent dehydrogenase (short-subunit alcohol dehydrogenase family)
MGGVSTVDCDDWSDSYPVHLWGPVLLVQAFVADMRECDHDLDKEGCL